MKFKQFMDNMYDSCIDWCSRQNAEWCYDGTVKRVMWLFRRNFIPITLHQAQIIVDRAWNEIWGDCNA